MVMVCAITLYLMPTAQREMRDRISQIRSDVAAAFIREGDFVSPDKGITVYLRETGNPGEMFGVFIQDERDPEQVVTYTAERALLIRDDEGTRLVMFDGIAQSQTTEAAQAQSEDLSILRFQQLAYDLTKLEATGRSRARKPSEMYLPRLLTINEKDARPRGIGDFRAEAHEALSSPLYVLALPLLAVAFVVSAGFRRQGFAGRIILAAIAGLGLRLLGLATKSTVSGAPELWPLMYLPPVLGLIVALWMLIDVRRAKPGTTETIIPGGA